MYSVTQRAGLHGRRRSILTTLVLMIFLILLIIVLQQRRIMEEVQHEILPVPTIESNDTPKEVSREEFWKSICRPLYISNEIATEATLQLAKAQPLDIDEYASWFWVKYTTRLARLAKDRAINMTSFYMLDGGGGWGDRLRGMTTTFLWAVLSDTIFDIPAAKWIIPLESMFPDILLRRTELLDIFTKASKESPSIFEESNTFLRLVDGRNLTWSMTEHSPWESCQQVRHCQILSNSPDWAMMLYNPKFEEAVHEYNLHSLTSYDIFRLFVRLYLTKLSPAMSMSVESFLNNRFTKEKEQAGTSEEKMHPETSEEKLRKLENNRCGKILNVGAHIRTGGDGNWNDPDRVPLDHAVLFAEKAVQICLEYGCKKCLFFVSSDAQRAKQVFSRTIHFAGRMLLGVELQTVSMDGMILHLDRSAFDDADEKTKMMTFIEWMALRKMDHLVLSQSGFGESAAWAEATRSWRADYFNAEKFDPYDSVVGYVRLGDW